MVGTALGHSEGNVLLRRIVAVGPLLLFVLLVFSTVPSVVGELVLAI